MIVPGRIAQLRELSGRTQKQFAADVGFSQSHVANVEAGRYVASESFARAVVATTGFPLAYLQRPVGPVFVADSVLFRSKASAAGWEHKRARRYGEVMYEGMTVLMRRLRPIPLMIPVHQGLRSKPHRAAWMSRAALGLGPQEPIGNLVRTLERHGILAAAMPLASDKHSALATWCGDEFEHPFLGVFPTASPERQRFSVAHELGHLVMHHSHRLDLRNVEREADQFAAELLMPALAMRREIRTPVTLTELVPLRARWGVSLSALVRRAHELELVTDRQYRHLFSQISARGWRVVEPPSGRQAEQPRGFRKMIEVLYGDVSDLRVVARDLAWDAVFLRQVLALHADAPTAPPRLEEGAVVVPVDFGAARALRRSRTPAMEARIAVRRARPEMSETPSP